MSAFEIFIYTLRYVSEKFLDIQVHLVSCRAQSIRLPVCWPIKSFVTKIFLCYFLSSSLLKRCLTFIEFVC